MKKEIVFLTSGNAGCLEKIANSSQIKNANIKVRCLVTDKSREAMRVAKNNNISFFYLATSNYSNLNTNVLAILCHGADLIISVDYDSQIPASFTKMFKDKMILTNLSLDIHDALSQTNSKEIQKRVIQSGETETGCFTYYMTDSENINIIEQSVTNIGMLDDENTILGKLQKLRSENIIKSILSIL